MEATHHKKHYHAEHHQTLECGTAFGDGKLPRQFQQVLPGAQTPELPFRCVWPNMAVCQAPGPMGSKTQLFPILLPSKGTSTHVAVI